MNYGLQDSTIEKINAVFESFPDIKQAVLYGSRAKGNYKPGSDIDLTLHGSALTTFLFNEIVSKLDVGHRVDECRDYGSRVSARDDRRWRCTSREPTSARRRACG